MKRTAIFLCFFSLVAGTAVAQVAEPQPRQTQPGIASPQPVVSDLTPMLADFQQITASMNLNLARLRIEKWKADTDTRHQAQQNADSISRNIASALPGMLAQVQSNPQSLAAAFKVYRNLIALYDVFSNLTESAGAFGPKSEYEALANDAIRLDKLRRSMGERLETMAALKDTEVQSLRTQAAHAAAAPPPPPKKIVVDDEEKPKKATTRKKPAAKPTPGQANTTGTTKTQ